MILIPASPEDSLLGQERVTTERERERDTALGSLFDRHSQRVPADGQIWWTRWAQQKPKFQTFTRAKFRAFRELGSENQSKNETRMRSNASYVAFPDSYSVLSDFSRESSSSSSLSWRKNFDGLDAATRAPNSPPHDHPLHVTNDLPPLDQIEWGPSADVETAAVA
ncbi:hypothetical protein H6P81_013911 [Aristolochia fimbriata]|uniref:Uncharacterized protein n=1 Tax=Aristolochia fimbriata TaxID=158543 RepID=A0AAV7EKP4_ARIFI|nr:hypothetical protein H6P81_013911 [Aristolochia fimbriata]